MGYPTTFFRRLCAAVLSVSLVLVTIPPIGMADSVFGTVQVSGPAWVSSGATDWSQLSATRPLVAGDRLKTGSDGYLLADLGEAGVVGLYGNAEIRANDSGQGPVIDVLKGKVAFHLSPSSRLQLKAEGAGIGSKSAPADGYVEFDEDGVPVVVVEEGSRSRARPSRFRLQPTTTRRTARKRRPSPQAARQPGEPRLGGSRQPHGRHSESSLQLPVVRLRWRTRTRTQARASDRRASCRPGGVVKIVFSGP